MADVIERAYESPQASNLTNWDHLYHWLEENAADEPAVRQMMDATQLAQRDGLPFPSEPTEARRIMQQCIQQAGARAGSLDRVARD